MPSNLKKYLKVIFEPIVHNKTSFLLGFLVEIFDGFQSVFVVVLMSFIISAIESGDINGLYFWTGIFIGISILKIISGLFANGLHSNFQYDVFQFFTKKYFKEYINFDNTQVESYGTGKMSNIISGGKHAIINIIGFLIAIFVELIAIIYIFILVLIKVPNIYYFIGFSFLFALMVFLFGKGLSKMVGIRKEVKKNNIQIDGLKVKVLMSKFEIFQNKKIDYEIGKINNLYRRNRKLWRQGNIRKNTRQAGAESILEGFYIVLFLVIGVGIIYGNYDIATFALLVWILQILGRYAWQIRNYMLGITKEFIDLEKFVEVFESIPKYQDTSHLNDFIFDKGDIEFQNIDFNYNEKNQVLEKFNLKLKGEKKYAFVGESGGGKSTLIKLLAGYISPDNGEIIIDKQKISEINLKSFYQNIGYLSQEPSVFDGSIIENLLYALEYTPNDQKIDEVIKLAKCEFVYDLENTLETQIGEKGVRLSGGEKQRLAIAKIMLKDPEIILLDEPTSALDSFNEEQLSQAFKNLFENKTIIIIAHRLQTVKNSDTIFYIKDGKIIEQGNHKKLLELKGNYYKMIELQSGF